MTKTLSTRTGFLSAGAFVAFFFVAAFSFGAPGAEAAITSYLSIGSTGSEVTELQTYLSTNSTIYPSGLVTGYFGPLTQAGVQKFQVAQGIVSSGTPETTGYGRVGPRTMIAINNLLVSGTQASYDNAPSLSTPTVSHTSTTVTYTWTTNEPTQGQVYWDTKEIQSDEATGPRQQPYVSGTLAVDAGGLQYNHSVTVSNLQTNTTYYFLVRSTDANGNMSMVMPSWFHTNF
jgi:peptidoglycan hydrolase-like protein with peptidoglycan-binding domain